MSTRPNRNGQGVTEAFIDEIIANPEKYEGLPLYADIEGLRHRRYRGLGHMLDADTNTFGTMQIGSVTNFRKVEDDYGISLLAEGRIPKREAWVCERLMELYERGALNFSFEILYSKDDVVIKDGVQYVDVSENNHMTGIAVVSVPAYEESTSLSMVAEEQGGKQEDTRSKEGDETTMTIEEAMQAIEEKDAEIERLNARVTELETQKENETTAEAEKNRRCAEELQAAQNAIAQKDVDIAALQAQVAELEPMKAELERMKAEADEAEKARKIEKAKAFAQKVGLNVDAEDVKEALEKLDFEALAAMAMGVEEKKDEHEMGLASYMGGGIDIKSEYGGLLERA